MNLTPETIISLIGIIATTIVGVILSRQIMSQKETISNMKTIIDSMKSFNDIFDVEKIKSYAKFSEQEAELRYKSMYTEKIAELTNKTKNFSKEEAIAAAERFIMKNENFFESYEEILSIPINIMLPMSKEEREKHLKHYPKNKETLRKFLEAIDRGEIQPGSSVRKEA